MTVLAARHDGCVQFIPAKLVDAMPARWWRRDNLHLLPGGAWHFCVGSVGEQGQAVRTIEWRGREIAVGRRPFAFAAHQSDRAKGNESGHS